MLWRVELKRELNNDESKHQRQLGAAGHFIFSAGRPWKTSFTIVGPRDEPVVLEE